MGSKCLRHFWGKIVIARAVLRLRSETARSTLIIINCVAIWNPCGNSARQLSQNCSNAERKREQSEPVCRQAGEKLPRNEHECAKFQAVAEGRLTNTVCFRKK